MVNAGMGIGAAAGTAFGGALALKFAALGSFAGPVGTLVGAGLGLIAGAALGHGVGALHDTLTPEEEEITRRETGLSQDDYIKFAAAAAEAGLSRAGGSGEGEYEELFKSLGLESDGNFETLWNNIKKLGTDFDELS